MIQRRNAQQVPIQDENKKYQTNELEGLASLDYYERLTQFIRGSTRHWAKNSVTVVDFRPLYGINIYHLQRELARHIKSWQSETITEPQIYELRKTLTRYTRALRDFEFIHGNRWQTCFVKDIAASRIDNGPNSTLQAALISELSLALPKEQSTLLSDADLFGQFDDHLLQDNPHRGSSRTRGQAKAAERRQLYLKAKWRRLASAVMGGLAIVLPVVAIVSQSVPVQTLLLASFSIMGFSVGLALFSYGEPESILATAAAYAAVIMVFVSNVQGTQSGCVDTCNHDA